MEKIKGVAIGSYILHQARDIVLIPFENEKELDSFKEMMESKVVEIKPLLGTEIKLLTALNDVPIFRDIFKKIIKAAIQIGKEEK